MTKVIPRAIDPTIEVFLSMLVAGGQEPRRGESADPDDDEENDDDTVVAPDALDELEQPVPRTLFDGLHCPPPLTRLLRST
jgi:hypothetical protein